MGIAIGRGMNANLKHGRKIMRQSLSRPTWKSRPVRFCLNRRGLWTSRCGCFAYYASDMIAWHSTIPFFGIEC